jgi:two-component system alkaline phosphatase synthesis response regulator PhoP
MRKKILVVDDDPDVLELLRFNFKKAGYSVGTALTGLEALKKACSLAPDLIVLDLMLPEIDGFAVLETLRRDLTTATVPVIMLTAMSGELARYTGMGAGANAYMTKPFSVREVISQTASLLEPKDAVHRDA